jgi:hypothetical protein
MRGRLQENKFIVKVLFGDRPMKGRQQENKFIVKVLVVTGL